MISNHRDTTGPAATVAANAAQLDPRTTLLYLRRRRYYRAMVLVRTQARRVVRARGLEGDGGRAVVRDRDMVSQVL